MWSRCLLCDNEQFYERGEAGEAAACGANGRNTCPLGLGGTVAVDRGRGDGDFGSGNGASRLRDPSMNCRFWIGEHGGDGRCIVTNRVFAGELDARILDAVEGL